MFTPAEIPGYRRHSLSVMRVSAVECTQQIAGAA